MRKTLAMLLTILVSNIALAGDMWKWKENGRWVYGDHYPAGAEQLQKGLAPPVVPVEEVKNKDEAATPAIKPAAAVKGVTIWVADSCGPACAKAQEMLGKWGVPFGSKDAAKSENFEEFKKVSPQALAPVLILGERTLIGFDEDQWSVALKEANFAPKEDGQGK